MKRILFSLLSTMICLNVEANEMLDQYNIVWDSPSKSSIESMPVGGHSIGCNVWVEGDDILFYAQRSGSFTENNEYHKLGRFRLKLTPNIFENADSFKQELKLREGCVEIIATKGSEQSVVTLWVEALRPVIHLDIDSDREVAAEVIYEGWRNQTEHIETEINYGPAFGCFSWINYPGKIYCYPDIVDYEADGVLFYHRNRDDKLLIDFSMKQQGLEVCQDQIVNTQKDRTFGGLMSGEGFIQGKTSTGTYADLAYRGWSIVSSEARTKHSVKIYTNVEQTPTIEEWRANLQSLADENISDSRAKKSTLNWWGDFWDRSWIVINPADKESDPNAWEIARNYQIFRYQLGCNAYGEYPTKFNGGNFTVDPGYVMAKGVPDKKSFTFGKTPDWRAWGGGSFTAQNQRLVYWPMLKSGDFDVMTPQFEFYRRALPSAVARTERYWGHGGCSFTEQMENFGLPIAAGWGWSEPDAKNRRRSADDEFGVLTNSAIKYQYVSQLEFSYMILEYYRYSGRDISEYIEFIKSSISFYDEHYRMRHKRDSGKELDDNGKLVIFPSGACEGYKGSTNPVDVIAGMEACLKGVLDLPSKYISDSERDYFEDVAKRVPEITFGVVDGKTVIQAAEIMVGKKNAETPQLYPLFPFNLYELGGDPADIEILKNTLDYRKIPGNVWSWAQNGIFYARLGMTESAKDYNGRKLASSKQRFPTFWGPGYDWTPDHNWGGTGMIGLQDMLMQCSFDKIILFPSWAKEWDVNFKLHAPQNTIVECEYKDGEVVKLNVTPKSRAKDVVIFSL